MTIVAERSMPSSQGAAAWVIVAGTSAAMHVGKVPVAIPILQQQLGMTLVEAGMLLSMSQFAGMLMAVFIGMLADSMGLRRSVLTGLILMAASSFLGGLSTSVPVLLLCRTLEGMAFLLVVVPAPALLRRLVPPHRLAQTMGVWGTFMPAGTATSMIVGPWVLSAFAWPVWWWVLSGVSLLCAWGVWRQVPAAPVPKGAAGDLSQGARLMQTWRNPGTWWVALAFGMYSSQWLVVIGFFPTLMHESGMGSATAGVVTAAASLVNIFGNVGAGQLLHRGVAPHKVMGTAFVVMFLGAVVVFAGGIAMPVEWRIAAALLFSGVGGLIPGSLFSLAVRLAPSEQTVSTSLGWTTQMSMTGQFLMPPIAAWLADTQGTWSLTWLLNAVSCSLGVVLVWRIRRLLQVQAADGKARP